MRDRVKHVVESCFAGKRIVITGGLGMLGVVVKVRLKVEPTFNLKVTLQIKSDHELTQAGAPYSLVSSCDWGQVVWYPHGGNAGKLLVICGMKTTESGDSENQLLHPDMWASTKPGNLSNAMLGVSMMQRSVCEGGSL